MQVHTRLQALVLGFTGQDELAFPSLQQWNCPFFRYKLTKDTFSWGFKKLTLYRKNIVQANSCSTPVGFVCPSNNLGEELLWQCLTLPRENGFPALLSSAQHPLLCYGCVNTTKPAGAQECHRKGLLGNCWSKESKKQPRTWQGYQKTSSRPAQKGCHLILRECSLLPTFTTEAITSKTTPEQLQGAKPQE